MRERVLGRSALRVSAIGLGCSGMSGSYGIRDDAEAVATIHAALDAGISLLDTSDAYGNGDNEALIGRAIAGRRDEVVIATKFGNIRGPGGERAIGVDGRPEHVLAACDRSLARLGVETIDLYFQHRVDKNVPIEDTVGAMARLVEAGKVRHIGICEAAPATIARAHATHPLAAVQTEYSLWTRDVEREVLPLLRQLGIGLVAYAPLGRGFLTSRIRSPGDLVSGDRRHQHPRFQGANLERNIALLAPLETLAAETGLQPAQIALSWVLSRGDDIVPIPGTKRRAHLRSNVEAAEAELGDVQLAALTEAFPPDAATGPRYPESQLGKLGL